MGLAVVSARNAQLLLRGCSNVSGQAAREHREGKQQRRNRDPQVAAGSSRNRFEDIRHSPVCGMWARDCAGVWSNVGLSVKK